MGSLILLLVWQDTNHQTGLYPVVTQPVYLLLSPWFSDLTLSVGGHKALKIKTSGLDEGPYIQRVIVNGVEWNKSWVTHDDLVGGDGGCIEFFLGANPTEWDTGDLPPSPGHLDLGIRN